MRVFDVAGRKEVHLLDDHAYPIEGVAFSPDGRALAALSSDASVRIWDPVEGKLLMKFDGSFGLNRGFPVQGDTLVYSPRGTVMAVALSGVNGERCPIVLGDGSTGLFLRRLVGHHTLIEDMAFSPDGTALASAGEDGTIRLWDVASGLEERPANGHSGWVQSVAFSPDGKRLATGGSDQVLCVWDNAARCELFRCEGHLSEVRAVAFSPDGATLASGGVDNTTRLWDAANGRPLHRWAHEAEVDAVAFSPDGSALAAADRGGTIVVREVATGKVSTRFTCRDEDGQGASFNSLVYAPKGGVHVSADRDGLIRFWKPDGHKPFRVIRQECVQGVCFSPDGLLGAAGFRGPVGLYDPAGE